MERGSCWLKFVRKTAAEVAAYGTTKVFEEKVAVVIDSRQGRGTSPSRERPHDAVSACVRHVCKPIYPPQSAVLMPRKCVQVNSRSQSDSPQACGRPRFRFSVFAFFLPFFASLFQRRNVR